ncbi:hypothetical protein [Pontibacter ruber]|uniref:Uncharacterized protein n=1 Tax=Pontibacter ruber TaxID=1343895 RepID=A0ABW5CY90_9BACT|nr:hypothetical protein [Pontibacter ruber]
MRKILFTVLFLGLFATVASAQQEFANVELPMRRAEDLVTVADGEGNVCVYFYQSGKLYFNLLSPSGQVVSSQEIPWRWNEQPQILGTRVTDDEFMFYSRYANGRRDYVRPFAINRRTGAFRSLQDVLLKKERGEQFIGGFVDADHAYMLYTDKKQNIHLYRDAGDAQMEKKTFATDKMPRTRGRYDREAELIFVHPDLERTVFAGHHRSKIYTRGDKVHMIFDDFYTKGNGNKTTTEILTLDWNSGQTEYRTLPAFENEKDPNFNSFLHNNMLFRVQLAKDEMNLVAYDFATLKPIKDYSYKGDQEIAIKSTPVHQRGIKALFSPDNTTIEKTSKVMKNLANGIPAITVDSFGDSTLQLTIGSYQPPKVNDRGNDYSRLVRTPDRYVYTSRGLMMIPGRWTPAYNIPSYYLDSPYYSRYFYDPYGQGRNNLPSGPGISTYFRAVLDNENLEKVKSDEVVVLQDKIEEYETELKPEPEFKTVYRYGDKLHYGYLDRKTRSFRIVEFSQDQPRQEQPQQQ